MWPRPFPVDVTKRRLHPALKFQGGLGYLIWFLTSTTWMWSSLLLRIKHVVTTSYINPQLKELESWQIQDAVSQLWTSGLYPGIKPFVCLSRQWRVYSGVVRLSCSCLTVVDFLLQSVRGIILWVTSSLGHRGVLFENSQKRCQYWQTADPAVMNLGASSITAKPYFIYPSFAFVLPQTMIHHL